MYIWRVDEGHKTETVSIEHVAARLLHRECYGSHSGVRSINYKEVSFFEREIFSRLKAGLSCNSCWTCSSSRSWSGATSMLLGLANAMFASDNIPLSILPNYSVRTFAGFSSQVLFTHSRLRLVHDFSVLTARPSTGNSPSRTQSYPRNPKSLPVADSEPCSSHRKPARRAFCDLSLPGLSKSDKSQPRDPSSTVLAFLFPSCIKIWTWY